MPGRKRASSDVTDAGYWDSLAGNDYENDVFSSLNDCVTDAVIRALDSCVDPTGVCLDAGCGPGLYLKTLSTRFSHVVGLDLSPGLIDLAKKRANDQSICNCSLRVQDLTKLKAKSFLKSASERIPGEGPLRGFSFALAANVLLGKFFSFMRAAITNVTDASFCIAAPDRTTRKEILSAISALLLRKGKLMVVAPSMESRLFMESVLRQWDEDAAANEGLASLRVPRDSKKNKRARRLALNDVLSGVLPAGETMTQHFLKEQLQCELAEAGLSIISCTKCSYALSTEFASPPKWMQKNGSISKPWDWIVVAQKQ